LSWHVDGLTYQLSSIVESFLDRFFITLGTYLAERLELKFTRPLKGDFMKPKTNKQMFLVLVTVLALVAWAMTPTLAKDPKNKKPGYSSSKMAAEAAGHIPEQHDAPKVGSHDSAPGPAWKTIGGTVKRVEGGTYTIEDYEGNHVTLHVGQGTKHLNKKKVGDAVRAEITKGGFANSIQ
jgi:hypothetical protein